jgi:hypothetical protein
MGEQPILETLRASKMPQKIGNIKHNCGVNFMNVMQFQCCYKTNGLFTYLKHLMPCSDANGDRS